MKKSTEIKFDILSLVNEYYKATQEEKVKSDYINYAGRVYDEQELINLVSSSLDFWLTSGKWTKQFEKKLSDFLGIKYCHFVNSGSSANLLAFMALTSPLLKERQIKRGDEVITTACCFPTTISPIIQYGAIPVFIDVYPNGNLKVSQLSKALSNKTKAVVVAHTLGNPNEMKIIKNFCDKNNLWIIEDNCDSLGSKYNNQFTGTIGDIGTSSFYPPHHITTGEGGAVYTNNSLLSKIIVSLRDWGRDCICDSGEDNKCKNRFNQQHGNLPFGYDHKYVYSNFGYNLKATDLQASIGCAQIDKLDSFIASRKVNWFKLYSGLLSVLELDIPIHGDEYSDPSWFGFLMITTGNNTRNQLVNFLEKNNIQTRNLFSGNIIKHPCFNNLIENIDYRIIDDLDNTNMLMNNALWVGVYPRMTNENIYYMINKIKEFFNVNQSS